MVLQTLRLQDFRNHPDTSCEFSPGINVLLGDNGQGKTNLLEAISYLCLTRSFYEAADSVVLRFGQQLFSVEGRIASANGSCFDVRVAYSDVPHDKTFTINKQRVEPFSSVIGKFPLVICSPEHAPMTTGGPAERRRFADFVISQSNVLYFQDLIEYRKVLKHRNKMLLDAKLTNKDPGMLLEPWNQQLVRMGSSLTWKRVQFVTEFQRFIVSSYQQLVGEGEEPSVMYQSQLVRAEDATVSDVEEEFGERLRQRRPEELRVGTSLVGPHRDELIMRINGRDLRKFASQGQHKTFLVALKLGEFFYLKDRCGETPLLLLDDIFSELDEHRARRLLALTGALSQTFVTATNPQLFDHTPAAGCRSTRFVIRNGAIVEHSSMATA